MLDVPDSMLKSRMYEGRFFTGAWGMRQPYIELLAWWTGGQTSCHFQFFRSLDKATATTAQECVARHPLAFLGGWAMALAMPWEVLEVAWEELLTLHLLVLVAMSSAILCEVWVEWLGLDFSIRTHLKMFLQKCQDTCLEMSILMMRTSLMTPRTKTLMTNTQIIMMKISCLDHPWSKIA